jgi:hypothetical protein
MSPNRFGFSLTKIRESPSSPGLSLPNGLHPLRKERDHLIISVQESSPAYHSGLREMDHLIQVNGKSVYRRSQKTVGQMIRESGDSLLLLVCDDPTFKHIKNMIRETGMTLEDCMQDYPLLFIGGSAEPPVLENAEWRKRQRLGRRFSIEASPILLRKLKSSHYTVN